MSTVARVELAPGYAISRVIKGGWQLAGGHGSVDRRQAVDDMLAFIDRGITCFDCADIYTGVEAMIGEAIEALRARDGQAAAARVQVHTKLVPDLDRLATLSHAEVEAIIDRSLQRLRVERLDLVQVYWWDLDVGEPLAALDILKTLRDKGKIRHLGCTNWDERAMQGFMDAGFDFISAQVQYSLLDARPHGAFTDWCRQHGISLFCYGVLAGGFLTPYWLGRPDPGFTFENRSLIKYRLIIEEFGGWPLFQTLLDTLQRIAARHGVDLSAVATRYMLDQPGVAATIIGARTAAHLDETLQVFQCALDADDRQAIDAVLAQRQGPAGPVYGLERDRNGPHGRIMKYNLNKQ